jgi:hypothetical protein
MTRRLAAAPTTATPFGVVTDGVTIPNISTLSPLPTTALLLPNSLPESPLQRCNPRATGRRSIATRDLAAVGGPTSRLPEDQRPAEAHLFRLWRGHHSLAIVIRAGATAGEASEQIAEWLPGRTVKAVRMREVALGGGRMSNRRAWDGF